jgi:altronate hydrolase
MRRDLLRLHPADPLAVALRNLPIGFRVDGDGPLTLVEPISFGHKVALRPIAAHEPVRKYGQVIGLATRPIPAGAHVHDHNLICPERVDGALDDNSSAAVVALEPAVSEESSDRERLKARSSKSSRETTAWVGPGDLPADLPRTFLGYRRPNGRVGTRNWIAVVSTVNCSAHTCRRIAERFTPETLADFPNVDGVFAVAHKSGCGMHDAGRDRRVLSRTLAGYADHPNVAAAVVIGLGCEVNQASEFVALERLTGPGGGSIPTLTIQGSGGVAATIEAGVRAVRELLPIANAAARTEQPVAELILGTNCGGSDSLSGITANPALGFAGDILVSLGGVSVLAETTEIFGAEELLTPRAIRSEVADRLRERIRWWREHAAMFGAVIDNNPSHGNKAGGLSTIFEKSLGAIAKGGSAPLIDVIDYASPIRPAGTGSAGLVIMDTPGFDPVSVTGLIAGGANLIAFTTGRGSAFGSKPAPTFKIATNDALYEAMPDDMDFAAGSALAGRSIRELGIDLYRRLIATASGARTASERQGIGDDEFAPWLLGPVL